MNQKFEKLVHSRVFIIVLILFLICMTALLGTYAWFTWSSTENTSLTMTIGKMADVIFTSGNEINADLKPVYNYYEGLSTDFSINNRDTTEATVSYSVKLNITTIDDELINEHVKYVLVKNSKIAAKGSLSSASSGTSITLETNKLSTGITSYVFYLYIDGNEENDLSMMGKTITGTITVEAVELEPTALSNFVYISGNGESNTDLIADEYSEVDFTYFSDYVDEDEILLVKYVGSSQDVVVPDTYIVDGVSYNVTALSDWHWYNEIDVDGNYTEGDIGIFLDNEDIKSVIFEDNVEIVTGVYSSDGFQDNSAESLFSGCSNLVTVLNLPCSVTNMGYTFSGCTSLVTAPQIPSSVTIMSGTFYGCTSLVTVPEIPSSVTSMKVTFYGCTSLVTAPEIPSSVTSMFHTFYGCTSLVTAPEIPSSVTSMDSTFYGCTSLVTAPEIPNSVTSMIQTFYSCTSLTGTVKINSSNITSITYIFYGTSKAITVQVPSGSTTYTNISALTTSNGMPSNVTLTTFE